MIYETLKSQAFDYGVSKVKPEEYSYITDNLKYPLYDWQKTAVENFLLNEKIRHAKIAKGEKVPPNHLMFNMATGSGKTLLWRLLFCITTRMATEISFFFVNQNAILGKTLSNFIESAHSKYLFSENIVIDGTHVNIREVELFSDSSNDIQIKFTTIQKLHNDIYKEGENALLLSDLQKRNIVLIGDEAHHLNASTSKKKSSNNEFSNDISFIKDEKKENIKGMYLFINKKKENPKRRLKTFPEDFKNLPSFEAKNLTSIYSEVHTVDFAKKDNEHYAAESKALSAIKKSFSEIPLHIRQKAVHKLNTNSESYFCFENLRKRFSVESIEDFLIL